MIEYKETVRILIISDQNSDGNYYDIKLNSSCLILCCFNSNEE